MTHTGYREAGEPSAAVIAQRPRNAAPSVRAVAEALPFGDGSLEAGMALWTIHHWKVPARGVPELRRVARRVIIVVASPVMNALWLTSDYWPGMARDRRSDIQPEAIAAQLGGIVRIEPLPLPHDWWTSLARRTGPAQTRRSDPRLSPV